MERRKEQRFPVNLKVGLIDENEKSILGSIKDFSREGLKAIFDVFDLGTDALIKLKKFWHHKRYC